MRTLTIADIILLQHKLINQTGGSHGIRDLGLIESALSRMQASFDGEDLYVTIESKVAAVTFSLINNHGFIDGNKRAGIAVMLLLLRINGYCLKYTQAELIRIGLGIASGELKEISIVEWIQQHQKS